MERTTDETVNAAFELAMETTRDVPGLSAVLSVARRVHMAFRRNAAAADLARDLRKFMRSAEKIVKLIREINKEAECEVGDCLYQMECTMNRLLKKQKLRKRIFNQFLGRNLKVELCLAHKSIIDSMLHINNVLTYLTAAEQTEMKRESENMKNQLDELKEQQLMKHNTIKKLSNKLISFEEIQNEQNNTIRSQEQRLRKHNIAKKQLQQKNERLTSDLEEQQEKQNEMKAKLETDINQITSENENLKQKIIVQQRKQSEMDKQLVNTVDPSDVRVNKDEDNDWALMKPRNLDFSSLVLPDLVDSDSEESLTSSSESECEFDSDESRNTNRLIRELFGDEYVASSCYLRVAGHFVEIIIGPYGGFYHERYPPYKQRIQRLHHNGRRVVSRFGRERYFLAHEDDGSFVPPGSLLSDRVMRLF